MNAIDITGRLRRQRMADLYTQADRQRLLPSLGSPGARRAVMLLLGAGLSVAMVVAGTPVLTATQPVTAAATADRPAGDATDWPSLEASARRNGRIPVVVRLRAPGPDVTTITARSHHFRAQRDQLLARFGGRHPHAFKDLDGAPFVALRASVADLQVLRAAGEVRAVSVDRVIGLAGTTSLGAAGGQQLPQLWDYSRIGADWANTNGWTGRGQAIVVIDTGVDRNHPYLQGKVVNEACFATNPDGSGACRNGATSQYSTTAAGVTGSAAPCSYNYRGCAHGTHVAHTAAGQYGVARGASIVAIRAAHPEWDAKRRAWVPRFSNSDLGYALWYVHDILPRVGIVAAAVNMSIGGGRGRADDCDNPNSWITYEINALKNDYEIPTVISSGNDNYFNGITWPACNSNAVSVGNTTLTAASGGVDAVYGYVKYGSNTAATLDLLAPGTDICSAVPVSFDNDGPADGWVCGWNGTSMAAPHVAGALAMLAQKRPTATVDQMVAALQRSGNYGGVAITDSRNTSVTRTRINVANTLYYSF
jgi:subtilisin family serine protease